MAHMISSGTALTTQFVLGMLHGLDVDHVLAVTGLASTGHSAAPAWRTTRVAFSWGLGHAFVLLVLAVPVLYLGWVVPNGFAWFFEAAIGATLVVLGLNLARLAFRPATVCRRSPPPDPSTHRAGLLGILHGTAGWFALSALLPFADHAHAGLGLSYLAAFSTGVIVAIVTAAILLGSLLGRWSQPHALRAWRLGLALASIGYGGYWIYVAR